MLASRVSALVLDRCAGNEHVSPPAVPQTKTKVYVLEIHEELVIETADVVERCAAHENARTTEPPGIALGVIVGELVVSASPRISGDEVAQQCVTDS
jgi:hypothetical protein